MSKIDIQGLVDYGTFMAKILFDVQKWPQSIYTWTAGGQSFTQQDVAAGGVSQVEAIRVNNIWNALQNNEPVVKSSGKGYTWDAKNYSRINPKIEILPQLETNNVEVSPKSEGGNTTKSGVSDVLFAYNEIVTFIPGVRNETAINFNTSNKTSLSTSEGVSYSDKIAGSSTFSTKIGFKAGISPKVFEINSEAAASFQSSWEKVTQVNYGTTQTVENTTTIGGTKRIDLGKAEPTNPQSSTNPTPNEYKYTNDTGQTFSLIPNAQYKLAVKFTNTTLKTDIVTPVTLTGTAGSWIYSSLAPGDNPKYFTNYSGTNTPEWVNDSRAILGPKASLSQLVQTAIDNGYALIDPRIKEMNIKTNGDTFTSDYTSVLDTSVSYDARVVIERYVDGSSPARSLQSNALAGNPVSTGNVASTLNEITFNLDSYNAGLQSPTGVDLDLKKEALYGSKLINIIGTQYGDLIEGADGNHSLSHFANAIITLGNGNNRISLAMGDNYNTVKVGNGNNDVSVAGDGNDITFGKGQDTVTILGKGKNYIHLNGGADIIKFDSKDAMTVLTGWNYKTDKIDFGSNVDLSQTRVIYNANDTHLYVYVGDKLIAKMLADNDALPAAGTAIVSQDLISKGVVEINLLSNVDQSILEIYQSVFGRLPDNGGFKAWKATIPENNMTIVDLAKTFLASQEASAAGLSGLSDEAFVAKIYQQTFDKAPDKAALANWEGMIEFGMSRADLVVAMATTDESIHLIGGHTYNGVAPLA